MSDSDGIPKMFDPSKPYWKLEEVQGKITESPTKIKHENYSPESFQNHHKAAWSKYLSKFIERKSDCDYQPSKQSVMSTKSSSPKKPSRKKNRTPFGQQSKSIISRLQEKSNSSSTSPAKRIMLSTGFNFGS